MSQNNVEQIVTFLRTKGLNDHVIAGILGNFRVESNFNPEAYNANEGAIGIGQWEGGRRTALQQYAAAHGGRESDLNMQLGYMWHELTTSESGVLQQLQSSYSADGAATIWDSQYERSSGEARSTRIDYARQYDGAALKNITSITSTVGSGTVPDGASGSATGSVAPATATTAETYAALGPMLNSVPELKQLLAQAEAGHWTSGKLEAAVEASSWYKTHSAIARSVLTQKLADPATYQRSLQNVQSTIQQLANQNGWSLTPDQLKAMATTALLTGNDSNQAWISQQVGRKQDYSSLDSTGGLKGGMAATVQQLTALATSYGLTTDPAQISMKAQKILEGQTTIDTYKQLYLQHAKSMYPGLSDQLDKGLTVTDAAQPYVQSMAGLLEVNPATLDFSTPLIKKALQGTQSVTDGKSSTPAVQPVWQFEDQVRNDPRWSYTDNAHQQGAAMLTQLGQAWGFSA